MSVRRAHETCENKSRIRSESQEGESHGGVPTPISGVSRTGCSTDRDLYSICPTKRRVGSVFVLKTESPFCDTLWADEAVGRVLETDATTET